MSLQVASEMAGGVGASATNATSFSYNFDCKGGSLLVVGSSAASSVNPQGISAVTYAGASLGSGDVADSNSNGGKTTVAIHHKAGPAGGVNLVAVAVSGGTSNAIVSGAIAFIGGSSNAAIAQTAQADDGAVAGTTSSVTVNGTTQGNIVLAVAAAGDALSAPTQTASWTKNVDAVTGGDNGAGQRAAGGGTIAFSWTIATSNLWAVVAVEVAADPATSLRRLGPRVRPGSKPNPTTRFRSRAAFPVAAAAQNLSQGVAGTLTSSGALVKRPATSKAGTLTSSGAATKQPQKPLGGTLTSSGAILKQALKTLSGTLTSSSTLAVIKIVLLSLAGTLTSSGTLLKQAVKPLGGSLTSSGALIKLALKQFAGTLTSSSTLTAIKIVLKSLAGTLTSAGAVTRLPVKALSGALTSGGTVVKRVARTVAGMLTPSGVATKLVAHLFVGTLFFLGALTGVAVVVPRSDGTDRFLAWLQIRAGFFRGR